MPYVYSTATADICFNVFAPPPAKPDGRPNEILKRIVIKGGANIITRRLLDTPRGTVTSVTDEELEILEKDETFKNMRDRGFLKVDGRKVDIEKAIKNLKEKDGSAPKTTQDFEEPELPKPVINKKS